MAQLIVDYKKWGLGDKNSPTIVKEVSKEGVMRALDIANKHFNLQKLKLAATGNVESYRGLKLKPIKLILLRFTKPDAHPKINLLGEHFSVLISEDEKMVHGHTDMLYDFTAASKTLILPEIAFQKALNFLSEVAPDMVPSLQKIKLPKIQNSYSDKKLDFYLPINDFLELHWINRHKESIIINGKEIEIWGMKVKMYLPKLDLWTWVIIDSLGNIQTFERDVFWDFEAGIRGSQMWLHDHWLEKQNLELLSFA